MSEPGMHKKNNIRKYKRRMRAPLINVIAILLLPLPLFILLNVTPNKYLQFQNSNLSKLSGTQKKIRESRPQITGREVISGEWQKKFEVWINEKLPVKRPLIKLHNQIYYSLFSKSYMASGAVLIGKQNYFYESSYLLKYCNSSNTDYKESDFYEWATRLQNLSNFFEKRGQKFIYMITPSKASYFPEYFPKGYVCNAKIKRPDYMEATHILQKKKIPHIDGSKIVLDAKDKYGNLLFPRGGIHWSALGASLVASELVREIQKTKYPKLPKLHFSYIVNNNPRASDRDLYSLANLMLKPHYSVPKVSVEKVKPIHYGSLKIAFVGGSFLELLTVALHDSNIFKKIDVFRYFTMYQTHFERNAEQIQLPIKADDMNAYNSLLNADIVILEENEELIKSRHFDAFAEKMLGKNRV